MLKAATTVILLLTALRVHSAGQGICVIDEMRVHNITGCVTDPNGQAISEATIELLKKGGDGTVVAKVVTDEKGCFSIPGVKPGRYDIAARYPTLRSLYAPVQVTRKSKVQKEEQEILFVLNGLMDKPCGGGTAHLRSKKSS